MLEGRTSAPPAIGGWLYVLATAARGSLIFAVAVFLVGTAADLVRARTRHEWPFAVELTPSFAIQ